MIASQNQSTKELNVNSQQGPFLSSVLTMNQSLGLSPAWAGEYESMENFSSREEILELLTSAPDDFSRGVVFGKLNFLQSTPSTNEFNTQVTSAQKAANQLAYTECHQGLSSHGQWSEDYDDTLDFCSDLNDFSLVMSELESLLETAPTAFCKGILFGKLSALISTNALLSN